MDVKDVKINLIDEDEEIKIAIERGIINDDEDDMRILDSLPNSYAIKDKPRTMEKSSATKSLHVYD